MSVTSADFINSAKALLSNQATEIDFRNAISRTYYSIFHLSKPVAKYLPPITLQTTLGSHDEIIFRFIQCPNTYPHWSLVKSIGYIMSRMKNKRRIADYEIDLIVVKEEVEEQLDDAQKITDKIVQLKKEILKLNELR
jgi:uncharacterized protein (UPF0332 family)